MPRRTLALRAVRGLARAVAWTYPASFRLAHLHEFGEVAEHLWRRERRSRSSWRATLLTLRILIADTAVGLPEAWFAALDTGHGRAGVVGAAATRFARFLGGSRHDVTLAMRTARRRPGFSLLVVLTLALGIGASATAFDALDRTLVRPLPFHEADRLIHLGIKDTQRGWWTPPPMETLASWRARATSLEQIEVYRQTVTTWHGPAGAERLDSLSVSGGLLPMLGVMPVAGRLLQSADAEPDAPPAVMMSEQTWRARFGSDPAIVSGTLILGDAPRPTVVVGILPAGARIEPRLVPAFITVLPRGREYPRGAWVSFLARMKPDASVETVEAELVALTPPNPQDPSERPDVATPAELYLGEAFSRGVWLVFAGALGLLAIAVVNAGHLLLGRATARSHELGLRLALGGSTLRLARLFMAEAMVYVASGLALGIGVMVALERLVQEYEPRLFMTMTGAGLQGRAWSFIGAVAGIAVLACVAVPLLRSRSQDLRAVIDAGDAARSTLRTSRAMSLLVVTQAAFAVLLVVGAAVMVRSFRNLMAVDSGMAIHELVEISAVAPSARYTTPEARAAYRQQVEAALQAVPTVVGVTTSDMPLLTTSTQDGLAYLDGEEKPERIGDASTGLTSVPLNYFDVTGMRLIAGRSFQQDDAQDVAVVNEAFAASRGGHVIGRLVYTPAGKRPFRIVGVVSNVKSFGIADRQNRFQVYFPERRSDPDSFVRFFVRTTGDPAAVIQEARWRISAIDPAVPMFTPETGTEVIRRQTSQHRFVAVLLAGLAALGFGLALSGVYGSVALNVSRRTREIGIRMALGATRRTVIRHVLGNGLRLVAIGGLAGVAGGWFALPFVEVLLYDVSARDPWSTIGSVLAVVAAAAVASWIPARRASRVDPASTLRQA